MTHSRQDLGRRGEEYAARRLEARGWQIRDRNWRSPHGEIDIVAERGMQRIFVEVRTRRARRGGSLGTPEDSIGWRKQARLKVLASAYLMDHPWNGPCRIDVVAILIGEGDVVARYTHLSHATALL